MISGLLSEVHNALIISLEDEKIKFGTEKEYKVMFHNMNAGKFRFT